MSKLYYICKYTPVELLEALGADCAILNRMPRGFERAEQVVHPNICGFGKTLLEAVLAGEVKELVLVNCCDTIRSVCDVLEESGKLDFLYLMDVLHSQDVCSRKQMEAELKRLAEAYCAYKGSSFQPEVFRRAFHAPRKEQGPTSVFWASGWGRSFTN